YKYGLPGAGLPTERRIPHEPEGLVGGGEADRCYSDEVAGGLGVETLSSNAGESAPAVDRTLTGKKCPAALFNRQDIRRILQLGFDLAEWLEVGRPHGAVDFGGAEEDRLQLV